MPDDRDLRTIDDSVAELDSIDNVPWMYRWTKVSHYYGDTVRQLLIAAAAGMLVAAPFYTDDLAVELPFIIIGTIILVCIAALTNPWKQAIISADVVASGVGLVIFEVWALLGYAESTMLQFVLREALALVFLFALYFSTKTLRSMILGQIGRKERRLDERSDEEPQSIRARHMRALERQAEAREDLKEINRHEKHAYED